MYLVYAKLLWISCYLFRPWRSYVLITRHMASVWLFGHICILTYVHADGRKFIHLCETFIWCVVSYIYACDSIYHARLGTDIYDAFIMWCNILFRLRPPRIVRGWRGWFILSREGASAHDIIFWPWISIYYAIYFNLNARIIIHGCDH